MARPAGAGARDFFLIRDLARYGYMDKSGRVVIPCRFDEAHDFHEGLAAVQTGGRWGYVDTSGVFVVKPQFSWALDFEGGFARVGIGRRCVMVDRTGRRMVPRGPWDGVLYYADGLGVFVVGDKYGCFNAEGRVVVAPRYDDIGPFVGGWASFRLGGEWRHEHGSGRLVGAKWGFLRRQGDQVVEPIPAQFDWVEQFDRGVAPVVVNGWLKYIDANGRFVDKPKTPVREANYARIEELSEGLAAVCLDRATYPYEEDRWSYPQEGTGEEVLTPRWGYIDATARLVIPCKFREAGPFSEGLAPVVLADGRSAYINDSGKIQFVLRHSVEHLVDGPRPKGVYHQPFRNGLAKVTFHRTFGYPQMDGYVDREGRFVWGPSDGGDLGSTGNELRDLVLSAGGPTEILAFIQCGRVDDHGFGQSLWGEGGDVVVAVYPDRATLTWRETGTRCYEWALTAKELRTLRKALASLRADDLPPYLPQEGAYEGETLLPDGEYLHIVRGKDGAPTSRRVEMCYYKREGTDHDEVRLAFFRLLSGRDVSRPRYRGVSDLPGFQVHLAEANHVARGVWKSGDDFRVLVEVDPSVYKGPARWLTFRGGRLGDEISGDPPGWEFDAARTIPNRPDTGLRWTTRGLTYEMVFRFDAILLRWPDGNFQEIAKGEYTAGVLAPDGNWLVVGSSHEDCEPVRIDTATQAVERIPINDPVKGLEPLAYVPAHRKVLLGWRNEYKKYNDGYLYDPMTRKAEKVKGEFYPFRASSDEPSRPPLRPLQPTGRPDEVWAALCHAKSELDADDPPFCVGRYNTRTFTFTPVLAIPGVSFSMFDMWVDEVGRRVYFVYDGQVLSVPLPQPLRHP